LHKPLGLDTSLRSYSTGALAQRLLGKDLRPRVLA